MARTRNAQTKHDRVREMLRQQVSQGRYPPGSRLPTENELPRLLRAGKQTVVRALNDLVREGLIVRRRGDGTYVTDRRNPPLIAGRQLKIGILWQRSILPDRLLTFFQGAMTRGILDAWQIADVTAHWPRVDDKEPTRATWTAVERGVTVECIGESVYSRERHPDLDVVRAAKFDGIVSLSIIEQPWLTKLVDLGIPTVLVDYLSEPLSARADAVFVDPLPGYRAAVSHFVSMGLQRIHFVGGYIGVAAPKADMSLEELREFKKGKKRVDPDSYLRLGAYRQALDECSIVPHEEWTHFSWYGQEELKELARKMIALPMNHRPEAVVCHSIVQARMLVEIFAEHGLLLHAAGGTETLSTGTAHGIHIDGRKLGEAAAALLLSRLQQPTRPALRVGVPMRFEAHAGALDVNLAGTTAQR